MEKTLFPSTNPIGAVFNDFINEVPLVETYLSKGKLIQEDELTVTIALGVDTIQITDECVSVNYSTPSKPIYMEMLIFIKEHLTFVESFMGSDVYAHKSGIEVYISQENNTYDLLCTWALED
ncbi:hypothetical protein [Bacteroides sp. 224]|uniref:hypothetical protein n=1 Tax=Bacteroides sp. 224 TaxID=2302936 RepID=UPI0013D8BA3A|nr:hypothetical protein [Bacteroides sp. 224]NDV64212.1 hypothetical protein [Bacteroides sp. 224]